jgi:hypothetical protein
LKYWRGFLVAAIIAFFSWLLIEFASTHTLLIDMVYPYVTRMLQTTLAEWASGVTFCLWQLFAILLALGLLTSIVLMIVLRWNVVQWLGWVTACASLVFFLHTALYGLNSYAGPLSDDIRLHTTEYTLSELENATTFFRDEANKLAAQVDRTPDGDVRFSSFDALAIQAAEGFDTLVYDKTYPVFAGSRLPVKELGWADMYTSMGITGFTMSLTGEAAVNPQTPPVSLPFTMCYEMAHRMCIANEGDANMAAFLACEANSSVEFRYSAFFMAYRYCYNALISQGTQAAQDAAQRITAGVSDQLYHDMAAYSSFFASKKDDAATDLATKVNDAYIKVNGDEQGVASYGAVCDLLVSWHIQEFVLPLQKEEEEKFDPYDESKVFPPATETTG